MLYIPVHLQWIQNIEKSGWPSLALLFIALCLAFSLHCTQSQPPCPSLNTVVFEPTQSSDICCSRCLASALTHSLQTLAHIPRTLSPFFIQILSYFLATTIHFN